MLQAGCRVRVRVRLDLVSITHQGSDTSISDSVNFILALVRPRTF